MKMNMNETSKNYQPELSSILKGYTLYNYIHFISSEGIYFKKFLAISGLLPSWIYFKDYSILFFQE